MTRSAGIPPARVRAHASGQPPEARGRLVPFVLLT